jgi:hypothetical protein
MWASGSSGSKHGDQYGKSKAATGIKHRGVFIEPEVGARHPSDGDSSTKSAPRRLSCEAVPVRVVNARGLTDLAHHERELLLSQPKDIA